MHGALEDAPKPATDTKHAKPSSTTVAARSANNDESTLLRKRNSSSATTSGGGGVGGGSGRRKTKCPELKYNKFQPPTNDTTRPDTAYPVAVAVTSTMSRDRQPTTLDRHALSSPALDGDVKEIKRILRNYINRLNDRDSQGRIAKEWRMVARVLDRVFFLIYLAIIIVSLAVIFAQMTTVPSAVNCDGSCKEAAPEFNVEDNNSSAIVICPNNTSIA